MKNFKIKFPVIIAFIALVSVCCSDLDENLEDRLTLKQVEEATAGETPDVSALLTEIIQHPQELSRPLKFFYSLNSLGYELIAPTRGGDWDDNGAWRALLNIHGIQIIQIYVISLIALASGLFSAIDILQFNPNPQQEAEARFVRAFYVFWICDGWGQVPMREPGAPLSDIPSVMTSSEAIDYVITELEAIIANLS